MKEYTYREAFMLGGYRERFAMEHGKPQPMYINGEKCYRFTYSKNEEYQDGNGAIYNVKQKRWID